jgi:adenine/guanine phosphoribosyltransferase-like PRPP-binding protein
MVYAQREVSFSKDIPIKMKRLALLDDTLATGGTFSGAVNVLSQAGAEIVEIGAVFETSSKGGRKKLEPLSIFTIVNREAY